jgi:transposase
MIQITSHMRIYAAIETIDFRKGIDGLAATCRLQLKEDPFSGTLFLFRNRQKNAIKILVYDGQGFWLCTKRLSCGKFKWWPESKSTSTTSVEASELQTLLWNGNPRDAHFSKYWKKI